MAEDESFHLGDQEGQLETDDNLSTLNAQEENENIDELYAQIAQKDRDLVLAAELGKALLDSNQELQSRYDQLLGDYNSKLEGLQQEKYALHLDLEKLETEHANTVKDLQDDISGLRNQLQETSQHKQSSETETNRCLLEAQQKSEYLSDQIQQAGKREEELLEKLEEERAKNKSSQLVIQDHLDHINMLREQVEYLSEKLKEATQALGDLQQEKAQLVKREVSLKKRLQHYETNEKQKQNNQTRQQKLNRQQPSPSTSSHVQQGNSSRVKSTSHYEQSVSQMTEGLHGYKGMSFSEFHSSSLFKPVEIPCRTGELVSSNRSSPLSNSELGTAADQKSLVPGNSMLSEFSSKYHHSRNRSDCSISSVTEGSRKRHYETIALSSDEEESPERNFRSANCKQSLLSKLIDSTSGKMVPTKTLGTSEGSGDDSEGSFTSGSPPTGSTFEESKESGFSQAMSGISGEERSSSVHALPLAVPNASVSSSTDYPWTSQSHTYIPHHSLTHGAPREVSLFDELSSHGIGLDRQDSGNSEKSLFDELSSHMQSKTYREDPDFPSSCLLGHPDFNSHSDWLDPSKPNGQQGDLKHSDSDSNYTCEWPLLSSVSADMLDDDDDDDDDFECDDDDFLVGNIAGSTLSIGDSGVGPMLKSFHSSLDAEPSDLSDPWQDKRWTDTIKGDKNKQCLKEACRQLRQMVVRLGGGMRDSLNMEMLGESDDFQETDFDHLLSLVKELRTCVDQLDQGKIPLWRSRIRQNQWQQEGKDYRSSLAGPLRRKSEHFVVTKDLRKSISSSSLFVRRSL